MSTSILNQQYSHIIEVRISDDTVAVDLADGRTISVPIAWYPRLLHGMPEERNNYRILGGGDGIHWPELDEDVSLENIILGQPSGESQSSFARWLAGRTSQA
jgi:hypothetical protein